MCQGRDARDLDTLLFCLETAIFLLFTSFHSICPFRARGLDRCLVCPTLYSYSLPQFAAWFVGLTHVKPNLSFYFLNAPCLITRSLDGARAAVLGALIGLGEPRVCARFCVAGEAGGFCDSGDALAHT